MWKINDILLSNYGIIPGQVENEGIAMKGIFDLPKRLGKTYKDWGDSDSFEPYVAADEIFLEGRTIIFQGILTGTKAETEANIEWLKSDISNLVNIAPFQTPYGSYCVYITKITSKIYDGIATVLIEMREPEVGAVCLVSGTVTTYYSRETSGTIKKNNCGVGYFGYEVPLTAPAGKFISTISEDAATIRAEAWVLENLERNAKDASSITYCAINLPIYYNQELTNILSKNDCAYPLTGSMVSYTIDADVYSSDAKDDPNASQAKADAKAQAALDLILTQTYANANGICVIGPSLDLVSYKAQPDGSHRDIYTVGPVIMTGTIYSIWIYSHKVSYTSISGDTPKTIAQALTAVINNTTATQWNDRNAAPLPGTIGFPPVVAYTTIFPHSFQITLDKYAYALAFITNP